MEEATRDWLELNVNFKGGKFLLSGNRTEATLANLAGKILGAGLNVPTQGQWEDWKTDVVQLAASARQQAMASAGKIYQDELEFVTDKLNEFGVIFKENGAIRYTDGTGEVPAQVGDVVGKLKMSVTNYNRNRPTDASGNPIGHKLMMELITTAFEQKEYGFINDRLITTRKNLRYDRKQDFDLDAWCDGLLRIYGADVEGKPQQVQVLKHLLWQIKRKLFGHIKIANPLMVVVYSHKGGVGKTEFFSSLMRPIQWGYNKDGKLADIVQGNEYKAMVQNKFLVDFAELALTHTIRDSHGNLDMGALNAIKSAFTSESVSKRAHYKTTNEVIDQTAVFVSSSNLHVYDVFKDPSGMRRFYEIKFDPDNAGSKKEFWKAALPYYDAMEEVFRSIDEHDASGYFALGKPHFEAITEEQEAMSRIDSFGQFCLITEVDVVSTEEDGYEMITMIKLRDKFNKYMTSRGDREWTMAHLLFILAQKDMSPRIVMTNKNKNEEVLYIKSTKAVTP